MVKDDVLLGTASPQTASGAVTLPPISPDCRAKRISGIDTFTECLAHSPSNCKYLLIYGHGRFCNHPLREQIVRRT